MKIEFPHIAPVYNGDDMTIEFTADCDQKRIVCAISAEALEDHFGAKSCNADDLMAAFRANRAPIEKMTGRYLALCQGAPVLLRSGHFRWGMEYPPCRDD
ncbi:MULTISPECIES: DUF1488 domain-containing protein [Pandoraea]|uniref:DUF1488 domain-containing protein n=1 Tax=Pandoraea communis TaxID=2508297 RepID=A0A5E4YH45_9BURK|nr:MULTISPECIES: DUF1488 domain-containing protein [Pandoraea]EON15250.1 hypothetical protein C266_02156 [Pandoraea sp. SD6-2]MDM8358015.1 DUF1488 domain-containing protein [Pandoraea communis]VVE03567.1 hypothetical protein PCO31111_02286 [Pandoraea communis]VVE48061.1 hypothetical protein PCO31110_04581 [Pandoraea communis]